MCSFQMYPPPHHIIQLTEFVLTYTYSLLALFFSFLFSFTTRQNKIKTKLPSCFQQRQWSCEIWGFLRLVRLLNLRRGSDLNVQQLHWESCFIFICCHLADPYSVIFFFFLCGPWLGLVWWCLSIAVLRLCQNFRHLLRSCNSAVKFAHGCQLARDFLALQWEDCFLFPAFKKCVVELFSSYSNMQKSICDFQVLLFYAVWDKKWVHILVWNFSGC